VSTELLCTQFIVKGHTNIFCCHADGAAHRNGRAGRASAAGGAAAAGAARTAGGQRGGGAARAAGGERSRGRGAARTAAGRPPRGGGGAAAGAAAAALCRAAGAAAARRRAAGAAAARLRAAGAAAARLRAAGAAAAAAGRRRPQQQQGGAAGAAAWTGGGARGCAGGGGRCRASRGVRGCVVVCWRQAEVGAVVLWVGAWAMGRLGPSGVDWPASNRVKHGRHPHFHLQNKLINPLLPSPEAFCGAPPSVHQLNTTHTHHNRRWQQRQQELGVQSMRWHRRCSSCRTRNLRAMCWRWGVACVRVRACRVQSVWADACWTHACTHTFIVPCLSAVQGMPCTPLHPSLSPLPALWPLPSIMVQHAQGS